MQKEIHFKVKRQSHLMSYAMILASIVVILAGIHAARSILAPVFMAVFLAVLLLPPLKWLRSKGISQFTSLVIIILSVLVVGTATTTILTTQLKQFADDLPRYRDRLSKTLLNHNIDFDDIFPFWENGTEGKQESRTKFSSGENSSKFGDAPRSPRIRPTSAAVESMPNAVEPAPIPSFFDTSPERTPDDSSPKGADLAEDPGTESTDSGKNGAQAADQKGDAASAADHSDTTETADKSDAADKTETANTADAENEAVPAPRPPERWGFTSEEAVTTGSNELYNFLRNFIGEMTVFASSAFIIMLLVIFMLVEAARLPEKIAAALVHRRNFTNERLRGVTADIRRYMMIKTFVSLLVGLFVTVLLMIMRVQYPFLWGVIAFLLNYIPNIGSVIAAIPPILLATVDLGLTSGLLVTIGMAAINCGIGYMLEPKLLGDGLDLSPLVVLLSLIFCGWLLGPVGMFLSPPLAVISKIILQSFPETRWIAVLMANTVPKEEELRREG